MFFLIGAGDSPSVSLRILADLLERDAGVHVTVHDLDIRPTAAYIQRRLDRLIGLLDEGGAERVGLPCSLSNTAVVVELCQRLQSLWPDLPIALWGPAAGAVSEQLFAGVEAVEDPTGLIVARVEAPIPFCGHRLGELVRCAHRHGGPLRVEPLAGAPLPAQMLRLNGGLHPAGIGAEQVLVWANPLLRAGVGVHVEAPPDREDLETLLAGLVPGRLVLEATAGALDAALVEHLTRIGAARLDLDLTRAEGEPDPDPRLIAALSERDVDVRGLLVFGRPGSDVSTLFEEMDGALRSGIEDLTLRRLLVPPGSRLRDEQGLLVAPAPPYAVLGLPGWSPRDFLRVERLCDALDLLRESLRGTGVLRALSQALGSAVELLEGFGERLAAGPPDDSDRPPERQFADYLRQHHGVDLEGAQGRVELARSPGLSLRWLGNGSRLVTDEATGRVAHMGRGALGLIDRCEEPQTIQELCEQLVLEVPPVRRDRLRQELRATVDKLTTMGFLVPRIDGVAETDESPFLNLDEFEYHFRMLMDRPRVEAYARAIARVVRPGQHVLEIGTGTGILAVLAARAGARVTAIERYAVIQTARIVAERSGVSDRIAFIRGRSDLVEAEPADVLVSELVGNRILNEAMLEVTLDARRRLLRPDARLIPSRITITAQLGRSDRFDRLERELAAAGASYGVDLSALGGWLRANEAAGTLIWEQDDDDDELVVLSEHTTAAAIDLAQLEEAELDAPFSIVAAGDGVANAVVLSFRLELQPGIEISTCGQPHGYHWNRPVAMLADPIEVVRGARVGFRLRYEAGGELKLTLDSEAT
jgi:2-polyprenyl-3-methyl-5-hydroxy-6-metoxy-1,4-benzoquinol methylase